MFKIIKNDLKSFYLGIILAIIIILTYMTINCIAIYNSNIYYSKIYKIIDLKNKKNPINLLYEPSSWKNLTEEDRKKLKTAYNLHQITDDVMRYYDIKDIDRYMKYRYRLNYRSSILTNYRIYKTFKKDHEELLIVLEKNKLKFLMND